MSCWSMIEKTELNLQLSVSQTRTRGRTAALLADTRPHNTRLYLNHALISLLGFLMYCSYISVQSVQCVLIHGRQTQRCHSKIRRKTYEEKTGKSKRNQELFTPPLPWNSSIETEYLAIKWETSEPCCWRQWSVPSQAQAQPQALC